MINTESQLLTCLQAEAWNHVVAMPVQMSRAYLLDAVFSTESGRIGLAAKDHELENGDRVFSLVISPDLGGGWWSESEDQWVPRDLVEEWKANSLGQILVPPRRVLLYTNSELKGNAGNKAALLDTCAGLEFVKASESGLARVAFVASKRFPFSLEVLTSKSINETLLPGFEEISFSSLQQG